MQNFSYTQDEADALVGSRFETLVEWDRVAKGRRGRVICSSGGRTWARDGSYDNYAVVFEWDRLPGEPLQEPARQSWFSKFQMEKYMRPVKP